MIKNLIEVSVGDDLSRDVLLEVMAVFSIGYNLVHGDPELMRELFSHGLGHLEAEGEIEFTVSGKGDQILH